VYIDGQALAVHGRSVESSGAETPSDRSPVSVGVASANRSRYRPSRRVEPQYECPGSSVIHRPSPIVADRRPSRAFVATGVHVCLEVIDG